ncbi:transcriptional regulator with XRE-family HTH domain [Microbacterium sp. SLBN-154]|uniref:helix-turn-helix domain-containing protein n=1 Tax=Microbacterium sp. SLBN-154 TaxID=2768458 RepID=UPI00114E08D1|nr:helix-turn-helix transcriptional regulator [Microbacterium sp. SLBN-154]TQK19104.1 transcriptional regulator with XRE-family HTH domain [Microbacterium sp. SLBN-154]
MRIEKIVGQNVARLRAAKGWSQPQFGEEIGSLLKSKPWTRQAVSNAEKGQRAFTVADLVALACVLETSPAALLTLPPTLSTVQVGDAEIRRDYLENPTWSHESTSEALASVVDVVRVIEDGLNALRDLTDPLLEKAGDLTTAGVVLQGRIRLEEAGAARPGDYGWA